MGAPALAAPRFEIANDLQLFVTDRFEAQPDQYLLTQPAHAHDADVSIDNTGEIRRFDRAVAHGATGLATQHRSIEQYTDPGGRNIRRQELELPATEFQPDTAMQIEAVVTAAFSHGNSNGLTMRHSPTRHRVLPIVTAHHPGMPPLDPKARPASNSARLSGAILAATIPPATIMTEQDNLWQRAREYSDILYETCDGIAKLTINRPERRNAFRPETIAQLIDAMHHAQHDRTIGVIILTGAGDEAFCSGGDQKVRGDAGYIDEGGTPHLNVLDLQMQIRRCPKPVVAMVAGFAIGGGHVLHLVCDLSIAAENARFGQTGPRVGSFDAGLGAGLMARTIGMKRAKEIWLLCRQYDAATALDWGLVNAVVPIGELEAETVRWCRDMLRLSPMALRMIKAGFNADTDGLAGIQELAGNATGLFYMTEEGQEGRNAWLERRPPDFGKYRQRP